MEPQLLAEVASAIADGLPVDWDALESSAATPDERELIAQLRVLAGVETVARSADVPGTESAATGPEPAPASPHRTEETTLGSATGGHSHWRHLTLCEAVGRGAFGAVYRALDPKLNTEVALKLIPARDGRSPESVALGEGRRLARVRHPNVVTIHGADYANGYIGLWMEFVRGRTLRQIVDRTGPLGAHEALLIGIEVTRALAAVHAAGLVHRDVKAQNVMREDGGRIVLMDFGAGSDTSGHTAQTGAAGTPVYMAPELLEQGAPSPQSDLYSLGVLLFYLVTGKYPIRATTWSEARAAHRSGQRTLLRDARPDLPREFVRAVDSLTAAEPSQRPQSAGAAGALLEQVLVSKPHLRTWVWMLPVAAVVVGALALASLGTIRGRFLGQAPVIRTLAVLPMVNLSGDVGRDYFVDGMTDQLISELSRIRTLRVTDRTSIMGYKGTTRRLNDIAGELGVEAVLEGSIVLAGSDMRLTASLIRAEDGSRLWSKSYERSIRDAFGLQAEMARDLADSIRLALTPDELQDLGQTFQASEEAQDLYLRGRARLYSFDRDRQGEACAMLERSVQLEPHYALAWSSLSRCYSMLEILGVWSPDVAAPRIRETADRAIAEDPSMAEAHMALADARFRYDWDWRGAKESYEQALSYNPSFSLARDHYARFLAAAGRTDEAYEQVRRAVESDPQNADTRRTFGMILFYQRRYDDALAQADESARLNLSFPGSLVVRARTLSALGRYDEAAQAMQQAMGMSNDPAQLAELGRIHAAAGRRDQAIAILQRLPGEPGPDGFAETQDAAYILAALGRHDEALTRLERAVEQRSSRVQFLRVDPRVDPLRGDARFAVLLSRLGGLD